jgi:hypothetical protein
MRPHWNNPVWQLYLVGFGGLAGVILFWTDVIPMWVAGLMLIPLALVMFGGPKDRG